MATENVSSNQVYIVYRYQIYFNDFDLYVDGHFHWITTADNRLYCGWGWIHSRICANKLASINTIMISGVSDGKWNVTVYVCLLISDRGLFVLKMRLCCTLYSYKLNYDLNFANNLKTGGSFTFSWYCRKRWEQYVEKSLHIEVK